MLKHLRRKTSCLASVENKSVEDCILELTQKEYNAKTWDCTYCDKKFNSYQNRWRHLKTCKSIRVQNQANELKVLRERIEKLEKKQSVSSQTTCITNNNTNNGTVITNNNNVEIRDFGNEDISYLPKEFLSRCFVDKDIVTLMENIHCDKGHPENHNIRVKSQKRNQIETMENSRWVIKDEDEALTQCIQKGYRILAHKKEIIEEELDDNEDEYHSIREWLECLYSNHREQKPIKRKLLLLYLNNRAYILGKDGE